MGLRDRGNRFVGGKIRRTQTESSTARHYSDANTLIQFVATALDACRILRFLPPVGYHTRQFISVPKGQILSSVICSCHGSYLS
jgi:hypothetical protein